MNHKSLTRIACMIGIVALSGCATVIKDEKQPIKIETLTSEGHSVDGARCVIESAAGTRTARTPRQTFVKRDASDLHITCTKEGYEPAQARVISSASGAMVANVFIGLAWAIVDHADGRGYSYPEWIQLTFGKMTTFSGTNREAGQPAQPASVRTLAPQDSGAN